MQETTQAIEGFNFFANNGIQWLQALGIFAGVYLAFTIVAKLLLKKLKKAAEATENDIDDLVVALVRSIKPPFYFFVSLYLASFVLEFNELFRKIILAIFLVTVVVQGALVIQQVIDYIIRRKIIKPEEEGKDPGKEAIIKFVGLLVKAGVWVGGALLILANLGVDVTVLVTSLGILSLGVGLAVKDVVSDIFAAVTILVDKPFVPGDRIEVNGKAKEMGTVRKIGIKTTVLQTKDGHDLLIANRNLTSSTIQNFKKLGERKLRLTLGVTYETSLEKLKKIPEIVKHVDEKNDEVSLDRVTFKELANSSLNFEALFTVNTNEKAGYLEILNKVNYEIFEAFQKEGIDFAYPTQTLFLQKQQEELK